MIIGRTKEEVKWYLKFGLCPNCSVPFDPTTLRRMSEIEMYCICCETTFDIKEDEVMSEEELDEIENEVLERIGNTQVEYVVRETVKSIEERYVLILRDSEKADNTDR